MKIGAMVAAAVMTGTFVAAGGTGLARRASEVEAAVLPQQTAVGAETAGHVHGAGASVSAPGAGSTVETTPVPGELTVIAGDFTFEAPASVPAGRTAVRLVNRGAEIHHIQLVRLSEGKRLDDLGQALAAGGPPPAWAKDVGGPNVALPGGGEFTAIVDLEPGTYALLCLIPSPDGVLHVVKGMSAELTVTPAEPAAAPAPAEAPADLTLTLNDYGFAFSEAVTAGTHRIRVQTVGRQSHEIVVFRLDEGRTSQDVVRWLEEGQQGPPPALPIGGVVGLAPGEENEITMTFEPGRYGFICFLPDIGDGAPHFVHGMIQDYTVQ